MIAELKITFSDPGAPAAYMYFEKTADWSEELVQQIFEQNKAVFGDGAEKIEQSRTYETLAEADADVKFRAIDHWNQRDMYLWPPNKIASVPVSDQEIGAFDPSRDYTKDTYHVERLVRPAMDEETFMKNRVMPVVDEIAPKAPWPVENCQEHVPVEKRAGYEPDAQA